LATYTLTTGPDIFVGGPGDNTFYATAATLNAGDSLTGGPGTDTLVLVGLGTYRIDQLASFTGFENIKVENNSGNDASLTLGNQPIEVDASGYLQIYVWSVSNWNGSDVINGDPSYTYASTTLQFSNSNVTYDLTANTFSHVNITVGNYNISLLINSLDTAGVQSFTAFGANDTLVVADATLDLSHTTVTGFGVVSSNGLGTTFTVGNFATAFQIIGGPGQDTIQTTAFTLTADQRNAIFATSSVEKIIDPSGTYTAPTASVAPTVTVPTINGTLQEGNTLSASTTVGPGDTVSYAWYNSADNCTNSIGTGVTYQVKEGDEGNQIEVKATAANNNGDTVSATSVPTATVADAAPTITTPVITGTPVEGHKLTATAAVANDADAIVSYQWQESFDGAAWGTIGGATFLTYVVQKSDEGAELQIVATSTDADGGGDTTVASSPTTRAIQDSPPVVSVWNKTASHGQTFAASSLFTATDADGDTIAQYDFWNIGSGGGYFVLNGTVLGTSQDNFVTAAQLSQVTYQSGSGADTLWVRASDGLLWSLWSNAFAVTAPIDTGPVVTPLSPNVTASHNQSFAASSLLVYSDPFGDAAAQYDVWNAGTGGGHFVLNGTTLGANQDNFVSASQLSQVTYQSGSGADTLWVRANDGTVWGAWSQSFAVTAPIDTGPVVTPLSPNVTASHNQSFAASSLFVYSDPFGDAGTQYDLWDTGSGGGHFVLNGTVLAANQDNFVSASQLAQVTYQSGSGADTLWVRASDGTQWSAWSSAFAVSAPVDTGPVVTSVSNITTVAGQTFAASSIFAASDPFGDPIVQYDFWDTGFGGGHFALNGQALGANRDNIMSAGQLAQTTYVAGNGTDTLWVRVQEGGQWSPWSQSFTISDPSVIGTGETLELASSYTGTLTFAGPTGTLKIDHSSTFTGTIAGQLAIGDVIDLADITAGASATVDYSGNNSPGTLTVSDGTHTAHIGLLGNYSLANFALLSDGHGGTSAIDPPLCPSPASAAVDGSMHDFAGPALLTQYLAAFVSSVGSESASFTENHAGGLSQQSTLASPVT
jgi:hypothetical protein